MNDIGGWEHQTLALIALLDNEKAELEQRLAETERELDAVRLALAVYKERHQESAVEVPLLPRSVEDIEDYRNLTLPEMTVRWAERHGDVLIVQAFAEFLFQEGLYANSSLAARSLYTAVRRHGERWKKMSAGMYQLRDRSGEKDTPYNPQIANPEALANHSTASGSAQWP